MARAARPGGEDLGGGAEAGAEGGMDGAPVARGVGVFACEEEGVVGGNGHFGAGVKRAGGDVRVGAAEECVGVPGVGVGLNEERAEVVGGDVEDFGEGFAGFAAQLVGGEVGEGGGAGTADPNQ